MKKNAKENFNDTIDDILSNSETGSKSFWQIMGRFMGKSQCSFKVPPLSNARSGGGVVDNTLDYQSRGRKIDPPLLRSFG